MAETKGYNTVGVKNMLNEPVDWKVAKTPHFTVKSFLYPSGQAYTEYTSHWRLGGWPVFHMTMGRDPETGRRKTAKGVVAVGRIAMGVLPIGQLAVGVFPVGQLSVGLILALGQAAFSGWSAFGQVAAAPTLAVGQLALAQNAVGQLAVGKYCIAQMGIGEHVWSVKVKDPIALEHFKGLLRAFTEWFMPPRP